MLYEWLKLYADVEPCIWELLELPVGLKGIGSCWVDGSINHHNVLNAAIQ